MFFLVQSNDSFNFPLGWIKYTVKGLVGAKDKEVKAAVPTALHSGDTHLSLNDQWGEKQLPAAATWALLVWTYSLFHCLTQAAGCQQGLECVAEAWSLSYLAIISISAFSYLSDWVVTTVWCLGCHWHSHKRLFLKLIHIYCHPRQRTGQALTTPNSMTAPMTMLSLIHIWRCRRWP